MMYGCLIFGQNLDQEKQNKTYEKEQNKKINNDENKKNPENPKAEDKNQKEMNKILVEEIKNLRSALKEKNALINQINLDLPSKAELELTEKLNQVEQHFSTDLKVMNTNSFTNLSKKDRHINSVQEISFSIVPKQDNEQPDKEQNKGGCIMF